MPHAPPAHASLSSPPSLCYAPLRRTPPHSPSPLRQLLARYGYLRSALPPFAEARREALLARRGQLRAGLLLPSAASSANLSVATPSPPVRVCVCVCIYVCVCVCACVYVCVLPMHVYVNARVYPCLRRSGRSSTVPCRPWGGRSSEYLLMRRCRRCCRCCRLLPPCRPPVRHRCRRCCRRSIRGRPPPCGPWTYSSPWAAG